MSIRFLPQRLLLTAVIAALLTTTLPTTASSADEAAPGGSGGPAHASEVSIFYYPWYATQDHDGHGSHWEQNGFSPPESIGSNFYPAGGIYSSSDQAVIDTHMQQIAAAGIDTIVVSWWGRGSYEDSVFNQLLPSAAKWNIKVAAHIEPYVGRNDRSLQVDHDYLYDKGVRDFYIYQVQSLSAGGVRAISNSAGDDRIFGEPANEQGVKDGTFMQWAQDAQLTGIYTYDPRGYAAGDFNGICANAHAHNLLCMPSVGPGWDSTRATKIKATASRDNGGVYDRYWQAAIDAHADIVTITSFNEWHEGTQIEPAKVDCIPNETYCYSDYEGAYGKHGTDAGYAYLARTLDWSTVAKGHAPTISQRLAIVANTLGRNDNDAASRYKSLRINQE